MMASRRIQCALPLRRGPSLLGSQRNELSTSTTLRTNLLALKPHRCNIVWRRETGRTNPISFGQVRFLSSMEGSGKDENGDQQNGERSEVESSHEVYDESFENTSEVDVDEAGSKQRLWLDPNKSLEDRVHRFVNTKLGEMHHLDITLASVDLIRECGKRRSFEGLKYAHDVLDRILEEKRFVNQHGDKNAQPIVVPERPFEVLMFSWANMCRKVPFAPQRMREVLDLMIQEATYDEDIKAQRNKSDMTTPRSHGRKLSDLDADHMFATMSCQPTVAVYNTLLQGLSQASYRSVAAAIEAEQVLASMERIARKRGWHTKPNTKSFMLVINSFGRTRHITAGDRAEAVLRKMSEYHERQKELYLEETGMEYDTIDPSSNRRRIVTPDTIAYTAVIQAHGQSESDGSAEKAFVLLSELIQSSDPNLAPDAFAFSATVHAFSKKAAKRKNPKRRQEAAERAEDVVWLMVDMVSSRAPTPNEDTPGGQSVDKTSYVVPFNACLNAWVKSGSPDSAIRCEELLQKMLDPDLNATIRILPNTVSFNTCMQAWAKAAKTDPDAPERAEEVLELLAQMEDVHPDATSYCTVMNAYAHSRRPDKASQTVRVFEALVSNLGVMPDASMTAVPFTILLKATLPAAPLEDAVEEDSSAAEDDSSLEDVFGLKDEEKDELDDPYTLALQAYDGLLNDSYDLGVHPDHLTFATMLDVVTHYTGEDSIERRQRVEQVVEDATAAGEVSSMVIGSLSKACPSVDMWQNVLQTKETPPLKSLNSLPRAWIRNVEPQFRRLRDSFEDNQRRNKKSPKRGKGNNRNKKYSKKKANKD